MIYAFWEPKKQNLQPWLSDSQEVNEVEEIAIDGDDVEVREDEPVEAERDLRLQDQRSQRER